LYHDSNCCEDVWLEDVCGDLEWLENTPILDAYVSTSEVDVKSLEYRALDLDGRMQEEAQWTFYRFVTAKGTVVMRWCGTSNGYYSVDVSVAWLRAYPHEEEDDG